MVIDLQIIPYPYIIIFQILIDFLTLNLTNHTDNEKNSEYIVKNQGAKILKWNKISDT